MYTVAVSVSLGCHRKTKLLARPGQCSWRIGGLFHGVAPPPPPKKKVTTGVLLALRTAYVCACLHPLPR